MSALSLDALAPISTAQIFAERALAANPLTLPGRGADGLLPGQVTSLRADADADVDTVHKAARMLEGFFLTLLLQQMRESSVYLRGDEDGFFIPSRAEEIFTEQLDQVMGEAMAQGGQLGLADVIIRQLLPEEFPA